MGSESVLGITSLDMAARTDSRLARSRKKTGRRPGAQSSRAAVLDAARARFANNGYDAATIRGIAADAGVDPALVMQFYGSKADLFRAVLEQQSTFIDDLLAIAAGPRGGLGERLTRAYLQLWEDPVTGNTLRALVRAAIGSQRASSLLRAYHLGKLSPSKIPEEKRLGLILGASHLLGTAIARYVLGLPPLVGIPFDELVHMLSPAIDKYLKMNG